MSLYLKQGNCYRVASEHNLNVKNTIPVGTYVLKLDSMRGEFFLELVDNFVIDFKLYGDTTKNAKRILNTFLERPNATGVMLSGEKGSGKTLLSKKISVDAAEKGIPTIIINHPFHGDGFNTFIQSIDFPTVIFFDEFEKVYRDKESQEAVLTLFDGVYPTKKLFMMTVNDKFKIDVNMKNRPGRIYYMIDFTGLDVEFIREYCEDKLIHKHHIEGIMRLSSIFCRFNFDMLKAVVEEVNRYDESPRDIIKILNTKPEFDAMDSFDIEWIPNAQFKNFVGLKLDQKVFVGIPLTTPKLVIEYRYTENPNTDDSYDEYKSFVCNAENLVKIDPNKGSYVYESPEYGRVVLTKMVTKSYAYAAYL